MYNGKAYLRHHILKMLLLFLGVVVPVAASAIDTATNITEYQIKAAFIYKFCLYIEWPENAFPASGSPIVIGIAGPENFISLLENIVKDRTVNDRPLLIRHIDSTTAIEGVHLLFVTRSEQAYLPQLAARTQNLPVLLVTESDDSLDQGSSVNFVVEDNRVRFDVGLGNAEQKGLRLSAQLLKVARNVRGASR